MNDPLNLKKMILDLVTSDNYQPLKPRAIAKKLKLLDDEKGIKRIIKKLVKQGRLAYGPKHRIINPASTSATGKKKKKNKSSRSEKKLPANQIIGTFRQAAAGFGFVTPQGSTATDRSDDIFIPKHKTLDAAHLDTVRIRVSRDHRGSSQHRSRVSGRVIEVIDRHTHQFVGTYIEKRGYGFVNVDGGTFETGILVGDARAKNCKVGDKVVIEMVHFPSNRQEGEGVIVEVLGDRGTPGVDTLSIIRQYGLPEDFPEPVLENAREQAEAFNDDVVPPGRRDFTSTTVVTIDPVTARDFDDAISLKKLKNGHWELAVHIADVSHFVPYRSAIDNEAFARATSIYLPDRVIPMLPEIISNNLASLQPGRLRYCMTAIIEFTEEGIPVATELYRGAIKSARRFTYEEIDDYLENDRPWKKKLTPEVFRTVRDMHTLAMRLRDRRMRGGAINLVLPEVKIDLDDDGKVCGAHTVENTESHQIIEEFMLAANEAVAQRLVDEELFLLRRVHPQPTEEKLNDLTEFVRGLGIECGNLQDRFELKRVIEASEGMPEEHAIHYAVLRSMQKAIYSPEEIGHYALNSKAYCHFTSPIRRYPDLIIHRMVGDLIDGKRPKANYDQLVSLGQHCSELEKRATDAERELTKLKLLNFMADKVGQTLHAIITGVEAFGLFAQGIEIPCEGMIPVANLPDDTYQYDQTRRTLSGFQKKNQFRLGAPIEVRVALVDPDLRELEFELVGVQPSARNVTRRSQPARRIQNQGKKENSNRTRINTNTSNRKDPEDKNPQRLLPAPSPTETKKTSQKKRSQSQKKNKVAATQKASGKSSTKRKPAKKKAKKKKTATQPKQKQQPRKKKKTTKKQAKQQKKKTTKKQATQRKKKTTKKKTARPQRKRKPAKKKT